MSVDRQVLVSPRPPQSDFLSYLNSDLNQPAANRSFNIRYHTPAQSVLTSSTRCLLTTRKGIVPAFSLDMNYGVSGVHVLGLNPSKLPDGFLDLMKLVHRVFGDYEQDLKICRIELKCDVDMPVDYFWRTVRVPSKRKGTRYSVTESNRGITGFNIGKQPAQLAIYDKKIDLERRGIRITGLPVSVTRLEWRYWRHKCPIRRLAELPNLIRLNPFDCIQIIHASEVYDFHNDPVNSRKAHSLNNLSREYGAQEAVRILNFRCNFSRDFDPLIVDTSEIKERLQLSYLRGVQLFLANQKSDLVVIRDDSDKSDKCS
ncbi:hypothetical protein MYX82_06430 [Acidobacteria bacterium AH-259-D05]|nr:hypothetical protein [Acidobacteria bacterium AH-259-D05]